MTWRMKSAIRANGPRLASRSRLAFATTSSLGSSITFRATSVTPFVGRYVSTDLQGGQDLNLQPAVLETAALPIEPPPYGIRRTPWIASPARIPVTRKWAQRILLNSQHV